MSVREAKVSYHTPEWSKLNIELKLCDENGKRIQNTRRVDPTKPMIALTFDDGPGKYTDRLLDVLEKYNARATFFMVGSNISKYPETVNRMGALGCEYGNHSFNHKDMTKLKTASIQKQISGTDEILYKVTGRKSTLVRPPYGSVNTKVRKTVKSPLVFWSLDTLDWKKKNAKKVEKYILKYVSDGEIVLMHDIHKTSVEAVESVIPKLINKGYQLVTVSEMAKARGITMKDGVKYFDFYPE